jgi:hypothetical protein
MMGEGWKGSLLLGVNRNHKCIFTDMSPHAAERRKRQKVWRAKEQVEVGDRNDVLLKPDRNGEPPRKEVATHCGPQTSFECVPR